MILKNGHILDPANGTDTMGDIHIQNGAIARLGGTLTAEPDEPIVDCTGKIVCPGLIDIHVHLREPGLEYKETIESGAHSAATGGFTSVACMPNTKPVLDSAGQIRDITAKSHSAAAARVYVIAALSKAMENHELAEMADLKDAGAVAVSDDAFPVQNSEFLRRAMEYAKMLALPVLLHCEDTSLSTGGAMNEGYVASVMGIKGLPREAYEIGTARAALVALLTGAPTHILHVSTAREVEIIRWAKERGAPVTAETAPHYWCLTDAACENYNTNAKMNPPLRTADDCAAIIEGLKSGTLDCIATDHAPHALYEKQVEFALAPFGIVGLETALALGITHLVRTGHLTLSQLVERMATQPARILNLPAGTLSLGASADITVFDEQQTWKVEPEKFVSKGRNTPFAGEMLSGKAVMTIVGGRIVWQQ